MVPAKYTAGQSAACRQIHCNLRSERSEILVRRVFPLSIGELMSAWIMVAAVSVVKIFLILFTFLI